MRIHVYAKLGKLVTLRGTQEPGHNQPTGNSVYKSTIYSEWSNQKLFIKIMLVLAGTCNLRQG